MQSHMSFIDTRMLSDKIRTPLTTIMGMSELISLEKLSCRLKNQIDDILLAANQLVVVADALARDSNNKEIISKPVSDEIHGHIYKPRVLLVEDDSLVQKIHYRMLEILGCEVEVASNGQDALAKVMHATTVFDLIFMDLGLPDMDGYMTTHKIRSYKNNIKQPPIVVLTAFILEEVQNQCLEAGANAVFEKPIYIKQLQKILQDFIKLNDDGNEGVKI